LLHVRTLGELRLENGDGTPITIRRKPLALLTYVARHGPRPTSRTELATLFWGERGEDRARQSLRQTLLELKQAIGDRAEVDPDSVGIAADPVALDLVGFEREVAAGDLRAAVDRWKGDFFEGSEDIGGDGFRRWIENERLGLHRQLGSAMQKLIGDAEIRGDWAESCSLAERWAGALRFDETAHLRLIEALRMSGRAAEAAAAHSGFATRVRTALDVEPSAEFLRLGGGLAEGVRTELARRGRGSAAVHMSQLAGRGPELAELTDAWQTASGGTPVVMLIQGEAGTGLTRLVEELLSHVGAGGVILRAGGKRDSAPYSLASTLFDGLRDAEGSAGASPEALAEVARIVPSLAQQFRHLPAPRGDESALRDALAQTLSAIGEEVPVLVFLDDAHAADEESLRLVGALGARLSGRVLLVVTADEAYRKPNAILESLLATRGLRRLHLHSLGPSDVEAIVGSMVALGMEDRHRVAALIHADTGGLPHHVCAAVAALVDEHLLTVDQDGNWRVSPALESRPLPVPVSVRDRIRARFDRLIPESRMVAGAIAVLGAPGTPPVIEDVSEVSPDAVETALAELIDHRFLVESADLTVQYVFASPFTARAVTALIPPTKRRALHARAAEVLVKCDLAATAERSLLPYHLARAESQPAEQRAHSGVPAWAKRAGGVAAAAVVVVAAIASRADWLRSPFRSAAGGDAESTMPVVALGRIANYREAGAADLTKPLIDMLATNLGRVAGMRVVSTARMYELVSQGKQGSDSAAIVVAAARRAGATELVDGALYALAGGGMRLDLRRVELATGSMRKAHSINGGTLFELADSGTARLAADFGATRPTGSVADVTTRSLTAYRLYEEGLRAFYENERASARQLFDAALVEDSTFAMAAYYAGLTRRDNFREIAPHFERALRLLNRASERERLTIQAQWALLTSSPALSIFAESLTARYPQEVDGHLFSGIGLFKQAKYAESIRALERAVAMDSASIAGGNARCSACDALEYLVRAYRYTDDYSAAERVVRRWIRLQPRSAQAWEQLHAVLGALGRTDEALEALRRRAALSPAVLAREPVIAAQLHLLAGNFVEAERLLNAFVASTSEGPRVADATWYLVMLYRHQGRLREAADAAHRYRVLTSAARDTAPELWIPEAQTLFESGRYRQAAALFDTVATWEPRARLTANGARARVWRLAQVATSLAAAGDTSALQPLADTLRLLGTRSGDARDQRLHHYVRALSLVARREDDDALTELARATSSPSEGYTRINLEIGRVALRRGRPKDAIAAIQPALRGLIEGSGYYTTRTELHEVAAHAWEAAGTRDSAMVH
jgi:DNA-binding SARP family transcriptional activator